MSDHYPHFYLPPSQVDEAVRFIFNFVLDPKDLENLDKIMQAFQAQCGATSEKAKQPSKFVPVDDFLFKLVTQYNQTLEVVLAGKDKSLSIVATIRRPYDTVKIIEVQIPWQLGGNFISRNPMNWISHGSFVIWERETA